MMEHSQIGPVSHLEACMLVYGGYNAGGKLTDLYQYCFLPK